MKKRTLIILMILSITLLFCSCGKQQIKSENEILADLQAEDTSFSDYGLDTNSIEVTKRKTDTSDKKDSIWCVVSADNEDITYSAEYVVEYVLYNEGWLLENWELLSFNYTVNTEPSQEIADQIIGNFCLGSYEFIEREQISDKEYRFKYKEINPESNEYIVVSSDVVISCRYSLIDQDWVFDSDMIERTTDSTELISNTLLGKWQGRIDLSHSVFSDRYVTFNIEVLSVDLDSITYRIGFDEDNTNNFTVNDTRTKTFKEYYSEYGNCYSLVTEEYIAKSTNVFGEEIHCYLFFFSLNNDWNGNQEYPLSGVTTSGFYVNDNDSNKCRLYRYE